MMWHILAMTTLLAAGDPAKQPQPGWFGVYPAMKNFDRKFVTPTFKSDKTDPFYSQSAEYLWMGGADRQFTATLARAAEFQKLYSEAEVKQGDPAPQKVEVGKHKAWLWKYAVEPQKGARPVRERLVVLLADDRILLLESRGFGPGIEDLTVVAKLFDLEKIKAALEQPPLTGSRRVVEAFQPLKKGMSYAEASAWLGKADKDIGSGIHIMQYQLDDGSEVLLGFPDFNKMIYAKHRSKDGKTITDLAK